MSLKKGVVQVGWRQQIGLREMACLMVSLEQIDWAGSVDWTG